MSMHVTAMEIARICGVSRGSVDRALNGRSGINVKTKELILKTALELGYKPDFLAKSLATGKTRTIGVMVFDVYTRFFGQLVTGIEMAAKEKGFFTYLALTHKDGATEKKYLEYLIDRKVDGIILFPINKGPDFVDFLQKLKIPMVAVENRLSDKMDYVGIDDYKAVADAVEFLYNKGHQDILYVTTPIDTRENINMYAVERRIQGFIDTCSSLGMPNASNRIISRMDIGSSVSAIIEGTPAPTAVLCSNDIYALEVMRHLKNRGCQLPHDISIMGFDNIDVLEYIEPGLTTVGFPIGKMAERAVKMLVDRIDSDEKTPPVEAILKHEIIERKSVEMI